MRAILLVTFFLLNVSFVFSQSTANYSFSNVTNASLTNMSSGSTNILVPSSVTGDFASTVYPIGFDFWLMGTRYANFSVNSNGLMRLGKTVLSNTGTNSLATGTNLPLLTAFWDNQNSYPTSSTSRVRSKLTGLAPNRVLTVEWKDFVISNNSASTTQLSTYQINLYETSGVFEYVYGSMQIATGSSAVTASIGMTYANANNGLIYLTSISSPAVLRTTAGVVNNLVNSAVVGNIANLNSAVDGNRVKYTFTSWVPTAAPSNLTFSAVGTSSMTLNWNDNSSNERGFVIYRSDDGGVTYNFVSQTAAAVTNSVQGALSPATTYHWKVYAVTEGALSASVTGSQATSTCGAILTNTMLLTSGGAYNWNNAALWSLGTVPTACENAVITFTRLSSGSSTATVNLNVPVTVNNLTINGVYGSSFTKLLQVLTNNYPLTVLGDLNISSTGGSGFGSSSNEVDLLASTGSTVTIKGSATIGQPTDTRISYLGGVTGQSPDFYFKGNITYNANSGNSPSGTYYFDGGASQTLTANATVNAIAYGNAEIGSVMPTTLTLAGTMPSNIYTNVGNLSVHSGSTLDVPYDAAFNQYTPGNGSLVLKANATLKLGDYFGGQTGSNFPVNFSILSIDPSSTVEYNYTGASSPVIYTGVVYGNLVLSNASRKYINANLFINGNFTNNIGSTFGCDMGTYLYGASLVNNGIIDGIYANSRFGFYGNSAQTYSGTGSFGTAGTAFGSSGLDINNASNVTLNAPIYPYRINLFRGTFINSNFFTIGNASYGLVQRGGDVTSVAGSFDTYPVINSVSNYIVRYDDAAAVTATGYEIPLSTNTNTVYSNNINGVTLTGNLNVTNDFEILQNTFNIGSNTVKIGAAITRLSGNINGSAGTIDMNGSSTQNIPSGTFLANNLSNLIISNTNTSTGVTLSGTLDIYRSLTFGSGGRRLTTGNNLTFKSTATETAWLGQMSATNSIVGDATVERYIPLHSKAWQFLSTPITTASTQTVKQAWQEGAVTVNGNPVSGYGTQLTSNIAGATNQPKPGFDVYTATPSIKLYNSATDSYNRLDSTTGPISNPKGYMVLVRGNRSVTTFGGSPTATVMRTKGTLHTPANPPAAINVNSGFESIGNPFASAIDFRSVGFAGAVQTDFFYLWDPKLTSIGVNSAYGLGGFQSFSWNGSSFDVTPGGGSYSSSNRYIESGQAFFVNAPVSPGTVSFPETAKVSGSNIVNRIPSAPIKQLRTNLYVTTGEARVLLDGNLIQYDRENSNEVDMKDGIKLNNSGENLGLLRAGRTLVVERRAIIQRTDTVFYRLGQLKIQQYEFELIANKLQQPGLAAFLEDNYLHTSTEVNLSDTSMFVFSVTNIPGSYAPDRFMLVFRQLKKLVPIAVTSNDLMGKNTISVDLAVKSAASESTAGIYVYPNPVADKIMHLQFINQPTGHYSIQLTDESGHSVYKGNVQSGKTDMIKTIHLGRTVAAGAYQLVITSAKGIKTIQQVIIH